MRDLTRVHGSAGAHEDEVVLERVPVAVDAVRALRVVGRARHEVAYERRLDAEDRVRVEVAALAVLPSRRLRDPERAEERRLRRRAAELLVLERVDERGEAERVGEKDELLPAVVSHVARLREETDPGLPLAPRQVHLAGERVQ